ncbi:Xaa-Pro dipeptidyl-peptidase, C-terminal [Candidatus Planktophila vernalis]|uniref:alpha/beta fold hydrolase n=1 Tax=Candidatus Planktophila vernalis TaxID=1884907 RepID=UPI003CED2CB5
MKIKEIIVASLIGALSIVPINAQAESIITKSITTAPGVSIDTSLYIPSKTPAPAILIAHGFGGSKDSVASDAQYFASKGYVVLTWTARGFGKSTGQISMNAQDGEVADTRALISYLSKSKYVTQDKADDPRVGIMGGSYGGANALLSASADSRIDAVIADITWSDLAQGLFPQSVAGSSQSGVFKKVWAGTFFSAVSLQSAYLGECGSFTQAWCDAYRSAVINGAPSQKERALLASVSPINFLSTLNAPTLLSQGQADSLFPLSESVRTADAIKKANPQLPLSMIWHAGGHDGGTDQSEYLRTQYLNWFKKHLSKADVEFPTFQFTKTNGSISLQDSTVIPKVFSSNQLPTQASQKQLPLLTPTVAASYPIGGIPSAISSLPGIGSAGALASRVVSTFSGFSPAFLPAQSGLLESAPLSEPISFVGPSTIKLRITSTTGDATLFFSLVTKSPSGAITQPNGVVAPVRLSDIPQGGVDVIVNLPAVIMDVSVGDVVAVGVSTTDQGYDLPKLASFYSISVLSPLTYGAINASASNSSRANLVWPILAFVIFIGAFVYVRLRRPKIAPSDLESTALVEVKNLGKVYKDGYRAVADLSFTVERGQVVGLLGPNGAGKTTTLRMVMGLIFPTEGSIYMDGNAVYPGSPALSNLGSFVEGPGFLPHLSGRENLSLYWRSIGRDGEQYLDDVVAITKLGTALDKKVRSYSQGMRQRLAIAQAMLGMPDLLVLDEPTNGLDPQQIAEMRDVLRDYASTGRTVIISSHLLAEVQQTCSHVVLMHRGQLIAFGPMKKILTRNRKSNTLEEIFLELIGDDLVIGKEKK